MTNLAIVGLGKWGTRLVRAVQGRSDQARFRWVVSRSPEKVRELAAELDLAHVPDLESLLQDPSVDGVVLATPHSLHADQIIACAQANKPVFVEKPFTLDRASAIRALAAAPEQLVVAVGHNRRFLPAVMALKSAIDAGKLGRVLFVESNFSGNVAGSYRQDSWRVAPDESPAGGMAGAGIHMIDLIIHLVAPIREVVALSRRQVLDVTLDDTTSVMFVLDNGAGAALTTVMATVPTFRLQAFGTNGTAELRNADTLAFTSIDGETSIETFAPVSTELAEIEAFAAAVAGKVDYPVSRQAIVNGVAAFEAVGRSVREQRAVQIDA